MLRKEALRDKQRFPPLDIGKDLFEKSDIEDANEDEYFLHPRVAAAANKRLYSVSRQQLLRLRDQFHEGKPDVVDVQVLLRSASTFRKLLDDQRDLWVMEEGVKPVFERGFSDVKLRIYFPRLNKMYRVLLVAVLDAFVDGNPKDEQDNSGIISHLARALHG